MKLLAHMETLYLTKGWIFMTEFSFCKNYRKINPLIKKLSRISKKLHRTLSVIHSNQSSSTFEIKKKKKEIKESMQKLCVSGLRW